MNYPIQTVDQLAPMLKAFRRAAGLTQADLAARLGITQQTYARLEANPQAASLARFLRVLSVLDVQMTLGATDTPARRPRKKNATVSGEKSSASAARPARQAATGNVAAATARKKSGAGSAASEKLPGALKRKPDRAPRQPRPVVSKREQW